MFGLVGKWRSIASIAQCQTSAMQDTSISFEYNPAYMVGFPVCKKPRTKAGNAEYMIY